MLAAGGFGELGKLSADELLYLRFGGGKIPGDIRPVDTTLITEAMARLQRRVMEFSAPSTPYLPRVRPYRADIAGDYDHLSRVREWAFSGWEEESE